MAQTSINSNLASNKPLMNMIGAGNIDSTDGSNINLGNIQLQNGINAVYATGPEKDTVKIITGSTVPLATGFKQSLVNMTPANYIDKKTHYFAQTFTTPTNAGAGSVGQTTGGSFIIEKPGDDTVTVSALVYQGLDGLLLVQEQFGGPPYSIAATGSSQQFYTVSTTLSADKTANDGWSDAGQIAMADNGRLPTETNY